MKTFVNRLLMAKKHICTCTGNWMFNCRMVPLKVKLSLSVNSLYLKDTDFSLVASNCAEACWGDPIIDRIGRGAASSLWTFGTPYIPGRVDPVDFLVHGLVNLVGNS